MLPFTIAATLVLANGVGWLPEQVRWNPGEFPIPYCITANATQTSVSRTAQHAAVMRGISSWMSGNLSCSTYRATEQTSGCSTTISTRDRVNNIFWESNWRHGSLTLGVTHPAGSGQGCGTVTDDTGRPHDLMCMSDADIELNDASATWVDGGYRDTDITSIVLHEYGHFIGLDHCNENNTCDEEREPAIMYAAYAGGETRVLYPDDVEGACGLYAGTTGGIGWPCDASSDCTSRICIDPQGTGYCTTTCGPCPMGYACEPNPTNAAQNVCLRDDGRNRALCEECIPAPDGCADGGECLAGLPDLDLGHCAVPCPNPSASEGGCPEYYYCALFEDGSQLCMPKSSNCNDLTHYTEIAYGGACTGDPPCATGLSCIGICTESCTGAPAQGSCPTGFTCYVFSFNDGSDRPFCAPAVDEGDVCGDVSACAVGYCLAYNSNTERCYRDCAGNRAACNNAQTCRRISVGGGFISVCDPPGVPPRPDRDAGVPQDSGTSPCACDVSRACDASCAHCDPDCGGADAGTTSDDAGQSELCACDETTACDPNCGHCDPECPCACDEYTNCDHDDAGVMCTCDPECFCACDPTTGCDRDDAGVACTCDPECKSDGGGTGGEDDRGGKGCGGCHTTQSFETSASSAIAMLVVSLLLSTRSRRARANVRSRLVTQKRMR